MTYETHRFDPQWWLENGPHTEARIKDAKRARKKYGVTEMLKRLRLNERENFFSASFGPQTDHGNYAVLWEDPATPHMPIKITRPSPTWLGMAKLGHILPPVWTYWMLQEDEGNPGWITHGIQGNHVGRGYLLHAAEPIPRMTEEQAMEYLVQMVLPRRVWQDNPDKMQIASVEAVPTDRMFRNAWRLAA